MQVPLIDVPILIAESGLLDGQRWPVEDDVHIGRDPDCGIVIPDRQVSRFHTRIYREDDQIWIEDLASKNGTYVNGNQIWDKTKLEDGDLIQISLVQKFTYLSSDATLPLDQPIIPENNQKPAVKNGSLRLDINARRVWVKNVEVAPPLSMPQFMLLKSLFENSGEVVPRAQLVSDVWGDRAVGVSEQALDALIRRLRERIQAMDDSREYIITVRGHGVRLDI